MVKHGGPDLLLHVRILYLHFLKALWSRDCLIYSVFSMVRPWSTTRASVCFCNADNLSCSWLNLSLFSIAVRPGSFACLPQADRGLMNIRAILPGVFWLVANTHSKVNFAYCSLRFWYLVIAHVTLGAPFFLTPL